MVQLQTFSDFWNFEYGKGLIQFICRLLKFSNLKLGLSIKKFWNIAKPYFYVTQLQLKRHLETNINSNLFEHIHFTSTLSPSHTHTYCWIGSLDCSIRIAIQFRGLDCDWQFKIKIVLWIWIVDPVFGFKSKSNHIFYQETKS